MKRPSIRSFLLAIIAVALTSAFALAVCTPFFDDLEPTQESGWTFDVARNDVPASATWALTNDPNAHSATHSFFSDTSSPQVKDDRLIAPPRDLTDSSHLIFWHKFSFETGFDGGVLEVSTDGGATWVDVVEGGGSFISGGYNGVISTEFESPIAGRSAWTGSSAGNPNMVRVEVDLGAFAGTAVRVRWRLANDNLSIQPFLGWWIDDVEFICDSATPTPTPTQSRCTSPYVQMAGPGSPGDIPADPTQGELTIERVNIGEPFTTCTDNSVSFVMKVNNLDPSGTGQAALPPNAQWKIYTTVRGTDGADHEIYVAMDTFISQQASPANPKFVWGRRDPNPTTGGTVESNRCTQNPPLATCPSLSGTFTADGTITIKLNLATPLSFTAAAAPAVGPAFTWDGSAPGVQLKNVSGSTYTVVGVLLLAVQETATPGPTYTRAGNKGCGPLPLAVLTSSPDPATGPVPLDVTFDGSDSSDPNPCGVLNSYTLDFGDGSAPVTQIAPSFAPHTYTTVGTFLARLIVGNDLGQVSINPAEVTVSPTSALPPALSGVVSRQTHGAADYDIPLPQAPDPRGVECRSGGANSDYKLVYSFVNSVTSVAGASVTGGGGSVSSSVLGPNANEYTVNLTGVPSGQSTVVTLQDAVDSTGAAGNVVATIGVLIGDTTGNGAVNSSDISQTKSQSGQQVSQANFKQDVTINGSINSSDISLVKSKSGTALPSP